jgi:TRAP-type transport system periplasmic protein
MLRKSMLVLLIVSLVGGILVFNVLAANQLNPTPEKPITLRFGYEDRSHWPGTSGVLSPDPEHAYAIIFKQYVESSTNGAVKVDLFSNSVLGGAKEMVEMVKSGSLDLCIETGVMAGSFPKFEVISIPYAFRSPEVAWWVFDNSKFWKDLMDEMEKETGLLCLGMGQNGVRNFTNNVRPIHEPADMEGLKFRVMQSPVFVKMVEGLGANAVPIAWAELYTALQTGVVDGEENPIAIIELGKIYEVQKYITLDEHNWSEDMLVINSKLFHDFPEDIQQIIKIAGIHGAQADRNAEALKSRITDFEKIAKNMEVYKPTDAEIKKFQEAAQPAVVEYLQDKLGEEVTNDFFGAIDEAEKALGYK